MTKSRNAARSGKPTIMTPSPRAKALRPILKKWCEIQETYHSKMRKDDALFWYSERANVGSLAAACWLARGVALEEYPGVKRHGDGNRKGRVDLWMSTARGEEFTVEAKHRFLWIGPRSTGTFQNKIEATLADADGCAKSTERSGSVLALAFVVPGVRVSDLDPHERFAAVVNEARSVTHDVLAAVELRNPVSLRDRLYPGVVLIGRFCKS